MKYNDKNQPLVCMMTQSTCYQQSGKMLIKGVLWHSTGANNPELRRYVQPDDDAANKDELIALIGKNKYHNDWNHIQRYAGLNCWIGKLADGTVATVQALPWIKQPWGCGAGKYGSCNQGWIQFEICEDDLNDEEYFKAAYREACEITAYLCKEFNIDPYGVVDHQGVKAPTILCHKDSYKIGLGCNHSDIYPWFNKYGKTMDDVRADVSNLLRGGSWDPTIYKVCKNWNDPLSNMGEFADYDKAVALCNRLGVGYSVYDQYGVALYIYPRPVEIEVGTLVSIEDGAVYWSGKVVPKWVLEQNWYVKGLNKTTGRAVINYNESGSNHINSPIDVKFLRAVGNEVLFSVRIEASSLVVRSLPHELKGNKVGFIYSGSVYSIVETVKDEFGQEWGKLADGSGWVMLQYTKRV